MDAGEALLVGSGFGTMRVNMDSAVVFPQAGTGEIKASRGDTSKASLAWLKRPHPAITTGPPLRRDRWASKQELSSSSSAAVSALTVAAAGGL
jgi:hypothetical protein